MMDRGDPMGALRRRAERNRPKPKLRATRVRKTVAIPPNVEERLQEILAVAQRAVPSFTHHALMVAILDQGTSAILDGDLPVGITRVERHTDTLTMEPE